MPRFSLVTQEDYDAFKKAVSTDLLHKDWSQNGLDQVIEEDE